MAWEDEFTKDICFMYPYTIAGASSCKPFQVMWNGKWLMYIKSKMI